MLKKKVRKVLHIVQNKKDKDKPWKIKSENQKESFGSFRTQKQAIVEAKKIAYKQEPSQVKLHGRNGKIRAEWAYKGDPYPPEG
jgi:hypothetical protein